MGVWEERARAMLNFRALHALGQLNVLELDQGDLDTPFGGGDVEDLADVQVDAVGLDRVCRPTTLRRVVWAIWSIAEFTFSIAMTALTASTTRK
jgi:hypothetical protein